MKVKNLAKIFVAFRKKFSVIKDTAREKAMLKYYENLIKMHQVFPVFNEYGILVSLCEVWRINEGTDVKKLMALEYPKNIYFGKLLFIANVTLDPNFRGLKIYEFYKKFLKSLLSCNNAIEKAFWYNYKRKKFTRMFGRIRWDLSLHQ